MTEITKSNDKHWLFEVQGFHLDACQKAKKRVADEHDIDYFHLRAKVVNPKGGRTIGYGKKYVSVVEVTRND